MAQVQWNFDASKYEKTTFVLIPEGDYRCRIESVEAMESKSHKPMLKLIIAVNGYSSKVWHYIVLDPNEVDRTNKQLGDLFDSFGIANGDMETNHWVGKVGGCKIVHEEYNGNKNAKIKYLLYKEQQSGLPEWKNTAPTTAATETVAPPDNLPW